MNATFKDIAKGGLIAVIAALVLRWLLPIPVVTTIAILMTLMMIQVVSDKFGGGLKVAADWVKYALSAGAALALYLFLRTIVGKMLGIYPNDAWAGYDRAEGFIGFFWQKNADDITILWEFIFAAVAIGLSWGLVYKGKFKKLVFGFLAFSLIWVTLSKKFGPAMTARESAIGQTVAAAIDPNSSGSNNAGPVADGQVTLDWGNPQTSIPLEGKRWSIAVLTPEGSVANYNNGPGNRLEVRFEDATGSQIGNTFLVGEQAKFGTGFSCRRRFRGQGVVKIWLTRQ